ncbi:MAG: hypothetical protein WEG40_15685 [Candidatus Rokuibacteriota bacterium]
MAESTKACPKCRLISPFTAIRCDCGYRFDALGGAPVSEESDTLPPKVTRAWKFTFGWGVVTLLSAGTQPLWGDTTATAMQQTFGGVLSGVMVIVASLGVRRGSGIAAWVLVTYAVFDAAVRIVTASGDFLSPVILFALAVPCALQLRPTLSTPAERRVWPRLLYELAFLQAALTTLFVLWSFFVQSSELKTLTFWQANARHLVAIAILVGLGLATLKRHAWAGYALVFYQCREVYWPLVQGSQPLAAAPMLLVVLYALGAYYLHREQAPLAFRGRAAVATVAVVVLLNVTFFARPTQMDRIVQESEARLAAVPGLRERFEGNATKASALGAELALKGARRLTDAQLIEKARLLAVILIQLDDHNCAEVFRTGRGDMTGALNRVEEGIARAWFDLAVVAITAEHLNTSPPQPSPSEEETNEAQMNAVKTLGSEDAARFRRVEGGDNFARASDADTCWVFRTMVGVIPRLDVRSQRTLARVLMAQ